MKKYHLFSIIISFFALGFLAVSCTSDDSPEIYKEDTNEYVNQWIYQQMKRYYYWNENISDEGNLSLHPKEYFSSLVHPNDRFSYALLPSMPGTFPKSIRGSFGFDITFVEHQGQVYGTILYVLSDSPAYRNGLKRGKFIKSISGIALNHENYERLYKDLTTANRAELQVVEYNGTMFSSPVSVSIPEGITLLQPVIKRIILQGNDRIGYLEIPHFDVGLSRSLLQAFQEFKSQSVNKVVLDLRYNGGGDISSATALGILLAPNIQPDDLFIKFKGNNNGGTISQSFRQSLEMNESQVTFQELRNAHPEIRKIYILCGRHTASASEIIINNLKPYMDVVTIGEKTTGKDVAGFPIEDDRIPGQPGWILYPSIYKLYNASNVGGYSEGIVPTITLDELQQAEIFPLGDPNEILLSRALNAISLNGRIGNTPEMQVLLKQPINFDADPLLYVNP